MSEDPNTQDTQDSVDASEQGAQVVAFPQQRVRRPDEGSPAQDAPQAAATAASGTAVQQTDQPEQTDPGNAPTAGSVRSDDAEADGPDHQVARSEAVDRTGAGVAAHDLADRAVARSEDLAGGEGAAGPVAPVDGPQVQPPPVVGEQRGLPPILPSWVKDRAELRAQVEWQLRRTWHRVWYHAFRVPFAYAPRLVRRSPAGAGKLLVRLVRWWFDLESDTARMQTVERKDYEAYRRLVLIRSAHRRGRTMILTAVGVAAAVVTALVWWSLHAGLVPGWAPWATGVAVVFGLGVVGRSPDRPVWSPAVVPDRVAKLTADLVVRALGSLGLAAINQDLKATGGRNWFPSEIARDGAGWRAEVNLPEGVTADEVIERRAKLASALRRALGCVWPEPARDEHPGRLVLWVGDRDFKKQKPAGWPLAKVGKASLFRPFPFGHDPRGRQVDMQLMFDNLLIGAMPRQGKTFSLRVVLLAAALDPACEIHFADLKGTGDNDAVEQVAHSYACGAADRATLETTMASIRTVHGMLDPRANTIQKLPKDLCPESKVTEDLARQRSRRLHPVVLAIDEIQELFESPFADEAINLLVPIIKRGPALGIMLVLSTQRPDADSLPKKISSNMGIRFCLRVTGHVENDMVLGTGAHKRGVRATEFTIDDLGIGWLVGASGDPQVVRSDYIDAPAAEKITARARAARIQAGTLTGHAAGDTAAEDTPTADVLADLVAVWPEPEPKAWNEVLLKRLVELRPGIYGAWTEGRQLTLAVKPYGVTPGQVWGHDPDTGDSGNRRGLVKTDVQEAIAKRDKTRGGGASEPT